ncbi:hypothetical protein LSM04_000911 [Trypanosoma melophagium]|uniref:uncharacterized protein n=1 Tax=Trypanosoma melophagium TaxID=715481 RepID=UPI00351A920F|nr:hypothetical protein LSM04_000911 [Trypanosoma melophagium]
MVNKLTIQITVGVLLLLLTVYYILVSHTNIFSGRHHHGNTHFSRKDPRFDPLAHCTTEFGTFLGMAHDIPAYSNCHRSHRSNQIVITRFGFPDVFLPHSDGQQGNFISGAQWSAAEYASRFLFHTKGVTFPDTGVTQEIWGSKFFYNPLGIGNGEKPRTYEPLQIANFVAVKTAKERKRLAPRFADVVVWLPNPERDLPDGHAAVVVHVEDDVETAGGEAQLREMQKEHVQPQLVYIAEQNFDNKYWEGKNYSRVLRFSWKNGNEMLLQDPGDYHIIGRIRAGKLMHDIADDDL